MQYQQYEFKNHNIKVIMGEMGSEPVLSLPGFEFKDGGLLNATSPDFMTVLKWDNVKIST
jgi:hypothetical protein